MRLELSRKTDLAVKALRTLDRRGPLSRRRLAELIETTPDYLARVMTLLVSAGWVESRRGTHGGYSMTVDLSTISMLDLVAVVEGPIVDGICVLRGGGCASAEQCAVHDSWSLARDALMTALGASPLGTE